MRYQPKLYVIDSILDFDHGPAGVDYPGIFHTLTGESQLGFSAWTFIALLLANGLGQMLSYAGRLTKVSCALPSVH